jgi:hypothetical protein
MPDSGNLHPQSDMAILLAQLREIVAGPWPLTADKSSP